MHKSIKRAKKSEESTTANECNSMQQTVQASDVVNLEISRENGTLKTVVTIACQGGGDYNQNTPWK